MARIRQDDIETVKERTDIVALVGQYLALKKSGHDSMTGLCPFHQEKSPSFSVSPAKGVFYCFGCGKGGDAITFLRELEGLSYVEAVERLAQQADGREAAEARAYLSERGITAEAIDTFQLGYAPGYPDFLLRRLSERLGPEVLLEAGLATRGDDGTVRDRFRGRITFPIHDLQGRHIGFGARILPSDPRAGDQAKYLNTAETPIYKKHDVLYNLHRGRPSISRGGEVLVVEGYTDVIGLVQAGMENVVATCGTALGQDHFRLMSRFAQRAVLAFDSDEAGARAAERAFPFQEEYPVQAVVMIMPEGLDPAEMVAKHGVEAVRAAAAKARPIVEYMVRRTVDRHDLSSVEGRSAAVADALPILEKLTDPVRRGEYAHLLADLAGVSESSVLTSLDRKLGGGPAEAVATVRRVGAQERLEREMLRLLARDPAVWTAFGERVTDEHLRGTTARKLLDALRTAEGDVGAVAGGDDPKLASAISALTVEPLEGEGGVAYAEDVFMRLEEFRLKAMSDRLRIELQKRNPTTDPDYDQAFTQLIEVDGQLQRLRARVRDAI